MWFKAPTPQGPWRRCRHRAGEIYTIPPSSSIYYVTYVKVYNSSPDVVYVGYTPGYYGTVVSCQHNHGSLRHRLVLSALYRSHNVVWLAVHLWSGSWHSPRPRYRMELRLRLRIRLLSLVLPVVGTDGLLRIRLVSILRLGSLGRGSGRQRLWHVGQYRLFAYAAAWANPYTGNYGAASRGSYYNTQTGRAPLRARIQHQYLHR